MNAFAPELTTHRQAHLAHGCVSAQTGAVSLNLARDYLYAHATPTATHRLPLRAALGCVLATDLHANMLFPPFARALMDGFAVRHADLARQTGLKIIGTHLAGADTCSSISAGETLAIATGAPMPAGADCVVRKERARVLGHVMQCTEPLLVRGADCEPAGALDAQDACLIAAGTRLNAAHLARTARQGVSQLNVHRQPRIHIILLGDELATAGSPLRTGQIYEHNRVLIESFLQQQHAQVQSSVLLRDDLATLLRAIQSAQSANAKPDLILLVGGSSVGTRDFARTALHTLGTPLFMGIHLQPGRPVAAVAPAGQPLTMALPGSPKAVTVLLTLLIAPLLARLSGTTPPPPKPAKLAQPYPMNSTLTRAVPARWDRTTPGLAIPLTSHALEEAEILLEFAPSANPLPYTALAHEF